MNITVLKQTLSELYDDEPEFCYPVEKIWNISGVSLKIRVSKDKSLAKKVREALLTKNIEKYIVAVDKSAPTRCIDGRIVKGWSPPKKTTQVALGAKIAGGTAHAALAHRIVDSQNIRKELIFEHDLRHVIKTYQKIGIGFGGHIDDHQKGWNTGCGAVDNINLILEKLQRPEPQEQVRDITKIIMGEGYESTHIVNEVIGRMLFLDALKPTYMPKKDNDPKGEFLYKKSVVKTLRKASSDLHETVPELIGPHNEVAVVLNYKRGMTLDNDRFSFDNNNKIQLFGWDIWEIYEEAERLYPYSMRDKQSTQVKAINNRMRYITTRILLGIATVMVLTDGSLKIVVIK